jgi:bifunctional non-homologous end joining protein LigD
MAKRAPLRTYRAKRDFARTPEPRGRAGSRRKAGLRFVVQKHDATALHYDVRLEAGGVMKSWAVPKGPSLNPKDKRLAMPTEDHPISYNSFEGVIPEGLYGAGEVIVWDRGTYEPHEDPVRAIARGHLSFELHGEKLHGAFALMRVGGDGKRARWILVKMRDEHARARFRFDQRSVVSGRTLDDLKRAG